MSDEEQTRDEIEELVNDDEPVQEAIIEDVIEEEVKPVKPKSKANKTEHQNNERTSITY